MHYDSFGDLLAKLRVKQGYTQQEIAIKVGYSKTHIYFVEKNRSLPSIELINRLSNVYNLDLNNYFKAVFGKIPFEIYNIIVEFKKSAELQNFTNLKSLITNHENDEVFQSGEPLKTIYYSKALCYFKDKSYDESLKYIKLALNIDDIDIDHLNIGTYMYSFFTYSTLGLLGSLYKEISKIDLAEKIVLELYLNLKENYFKNSNLVKYSTIQVVKMYIVAMNNLSCYSLNKGNYEEAFNYIDSAIKFCVKHYRPNILHSLYFTKAECLFCMNKITEAVENLNYCFVFCSAIDRPDLAINLLEELEEDYPEFLKYVDVKQIRQKFYI